MDSYLFLKWLHILGAAVIAGTGAGIAFFMFMACRTGQRQPVAVITRLVVIADWLFTAPAVVLQLVTGLLLMEKLNYSFQSPWFYWALGLFAFTGLCWLPVVGIQYRLRNLANDDGTVFPPVRFKILMRIWVALGIPAFTAVIALFWLMVVKPLPVV